MENTPEHTSNEPSKLPYQLIRQITNDFHQDRVLGSGTFGIVYKGVYEHGEEIAVKVLRKISGGLDDTEFQKEFNNLKGLNHENIVELVGFCNEWEEEPAEFEGRQITAGRVRTALCFEYVQNGGLDKLITDQYTGLDWHTRYTIIKGVCEGLKYLREEPEHPIIHLDLKPENILLDKNMVAKIADFGISKLIGEENTKKTMSTIGTVGYWPPEYIKHQIISEEFDIFSLGVLIVKIMVGPESYSSIVEKTTQTSVRHVHETWKNRLHETTSNQRLLEVYCNQVKRCIGIALDCLKSNRQERPTIQHIVSILNEEDIMICDHGIQNEQVGQDDRDSATLPSDVSCIAINSRPLDRVHSELLYLEDSELLRVTPQELRFPFMSPLPQKKAMISCSLQLNNKKKDRVAFMLVANNPKRYLTKKPLFGVVPPNCVYTLSLTMAKQPRPTSSSSSDSGGDFFTLQSVAVSEYKLRYFDKDSLSVKYKELFEEARKNTVAGEGVHEVTLKASICDRPAGEGTSSYSEIVTLPDAQQVSSIDVHPTEPWIMTTNHVGILRVWNYHTMTTLNSFDIVTYEPVRAAKFVAREKWVIAGDENGCIHVYDYDQNEHVESLDAHDSCITTLVVHPTQPFILSLSDDDDKPLIKLWSWDKGWECTREFQGHDNKVTQVTFNPKEGDSFASASFDGTIKIWSISSHDPSNIITLKLEHTLPDFRGLPYIRESLLCVDYFTRRNQQHLIVGCKDRTAQIWKLGKNGCFDKLEGHADHVSAVNLHPELPLLITGSLDGTIRVWNSTTYKLENIIGFNLGAVYAFGCIKDSRRIIVGCHDGIAMVEISWLPDQVVSG